MCFIKQVPSNRRKGEQRLIFDNRTGFIDIHTHILPGVDDGSKDINESIGMLEKAYEEGIRSIIATPHYMCGSDNTKPEQLMELTNTLQKKAYDIAEDFKIYLGNELFYSDGITEALQGKQALTLAGSRYVLVEFFPKVTYTTIYQGLQKLILAGYAPILAHMERYECLTKEERLIEIKELGVYLQMNSASLTGNFLNAKSVHNRKLFYEGSIDFIGTDTHNLTYRPPMMQTCIKAVEKKCEGILLKKALMDNAAMILSNQYI